MAALTDLSDVINRVTGGSSGTPENIFFFKDARIGPGLGVAGVTVAGRFTSLWQFAGQPSHGTIPTTAAVPTNATSGSLKQVNPGSGRQKWLLGVTGAALASGTLTLFDRLLHCGSLSATVTTAQTVGGTINRNTNGIGNQIWVEVYSTIGATSTTITANYTNQAGISNQVTEATAFGNTGFREAQRMIQLPLASGDTGVQSVQSVTVLATTGTAGNFGVSILKPLVNIPMGLIGTGNVRDLISGLPGIMEIDTGACLFFGWLANTSTPPSFFGSVHMIEK